MLSETRGGLDNSGSRDEGREFASLGVPRREEMDGERAIGGDTAGSIFSSASSTEFSVRARPSIREITPLLARAAIGGRACGFVNDEPVDKSRMDDRSRTTVGVDGNVDERWRIDGGRAARGLDGVEGEALLFLDEREEYVRIGLDGEAKL